MLPKITVKIKERNPQFVPKYMGDAAINMDEYYGEYDIEVEVVQLNLNTGGMRVRYMWPDKLVKKGESMQSRDLPITAFFDKFAIVEKLLDTSV